MLLIIDKLLCLRNNVTMLYNRVAVLRTEAHMSRQELADHLEVNYQTVGFIERGDYSPSLELAFRIARAFNVALTDIFSDTPFEPLFAKKENSHD